MRILLYSVCYFLLIQLASAQVYIEGGKSRHRFAQLNLGLDLRSFPSHGTESTYLVSPGIFREMSLQRQTETRLLIGGTHFWGHADFQLAFPIASFGRSGFSTGVETTFKYFPWQIESGKARPFVGLSWQPNYFQQAGGVKQLRNSFPISAGLVYANNNHLIEISSGYNFESKRNYFINTKNMVAVRTHPIWIGLAYKYMLETTLGAEKNWLNGRTAFLTDTLGKLGKLNGFTLGIGPSSVLFLSKSHYNEKNQAFLDEHKISEVYMEYTFGYYIHASDMQLNLIYKNINSHLEAYDYSQSLNRRSLGIEAAKFFMDYHGFAAFIGAGISQEYFSIKEVNPLEETLISRQKGVHAALLLGWDIRPDRLQAVYLRTNIRWYPKLTVEMNNGENFSLDQMEINFIQLIIFPGRLF